MYLGGNRRWVPLKNITFTGKKKVVFDIAGHQGGWILSKLRPASVRALRGIPQIP